MHDNIDIYAEGILTDQRYNYTAGVFQELVFDVTVSDEQLNIRILDDGGVRPNWVITALTIGLVLLLRCRLRGRLTLVLLVRQLQQVTLRLLSLLCTRQVLGYGWRSIAGLQSRDRAAPADLRRDLVLGATGHTFNVDLANGDYEVTITIGDQLYLHDKIDVYAEDIQKINDLSTVAGVFQELTFYVTVSDEQLNIRILDQGGVQPDWVINALTIVPGSAPALPTEGSFDFGTSGSPVAAGYTQVTESTLYSAVLGYGWSSIAGLQSRDRGAPADLTRDLVLGATEHTFNVDLANGDYEVTITIGDQLYLHDLIDVYAEDIQNQ